MSWVSFAVSRDDSVGSIYSYLYSQQSRTLSTPWQRSSVLKRRAFSSFLLTLHSKVPWITCKVLLTLTTVWKKVNTHFARASKYNQPDVPTGFILSFSLLTWEERIFWLEETLTQTICLWKTVHIKKHIKVLDTWLEIVRMQMFYQSWVSHEVSQKSGWKEMFPK